MAKSHPGITAANINFELEVKMYKFIIILFVLLGCTSTEKVNKSEVNITLEEIEESRFIKGIIGAENICLDQDSMKVYISDISGNLTLIDGDNFNELEISKSKKVGNLVLGIAQDGDKNLYAGICNYDVKQWKDKGGAVYKFDSNLEDMDKITADYPGINGMTIDNNSQLYFASSNFDAFDSQGNIFKIDLNRPSEVEVFIADTGMSNGLYFDPQLNQVFYSDTTTGVYMFNLNTPILTKVFEPQRFWGLIDDLGTDSNGRIWMSDPGGSFVKCFDPESNKLVYFKIKDLGHASSCRVRNENGRDILYITELTLKGKGIYDGRGLIILPIDSLNEYL